MLTPPMTRGGIPAVIVVIWDGGGNSAPSARSGELVWLWARHGGEGDESIPRFVEANAERLRAAYLSFVHDIGEARVGDRTIVERLARTDGFSFWWMGLISEKSPFKSPAIYACIRLLALEERLAAVRPAKVRLESADRRLVRAVRVLCEGMGIAFECTTSASTGPRWSMRRLYEALPAPARAALAAARRLHMLWPLRHVRARQWHAGPSAVSFFSYFIHLDAARCGNGEFYSRQWEVLPGALTSSRRRLNWVHHFLQSTACPDAECGRAWCEKFERNADREGHHTFVDSYVSLPILWRALCDFVVTWARAPRHWQIRHLFFAAGSRAWLWPFLQASWSDSVAGPVAMMNCLWLSQFDALLATMPRQEVGLYLYENQGWERALLRAWRRHGHGRIIAVQHSTVPFWHLYYAQDSRTSHATGSFALPKPDAVAVNGPAARRALIEGAYPVAELVDVEALRYLGLNQLTPRSPSKSNGGANEPLPFRVLLLGDIIHGAMDALLRTLEGVITRLPPDFEFTFKPHPGYPIALPVSLQARVRVTTEALADIMPSYDAAVSANSTSASVDAFVAGLAVIVMHAGTELNLSPLRGESGIRFAGSATELATLLKEVRALRTRGSPPPPPAPMFLVDPDLPRWRQLLRTPVLERCDG